MGGNLFFFLLASRNFQFYQKFVGIYDWSDSEGGLGDSPGLFRRTPTKPNDGGHSSVLCHLTDRVYISRLHQNAFRHWWCNAYKGTDQCEEFFKMLFKIDIKIHTVMEIIDLDIHVQVYLIVFDFRRWDT